MRPSTKCGLSVDPFVPGLSNSCKLCVLLQRLDPRNTQEANDCTNLLESLSGSHSGEQGFIPKLLNLSRLILPWRDQDYFHTKWCEIPWSPEKSERSSISGSPLVNGNNSAPYSPPKMLNSVTISYTSWKTASIRRLYRALKQTAFSSELTGQQGSMLPSSSVLFFDNVIS